MSEHVTIVSATDESAYYGGIWKYEQAMFRALRANGVEPQRLHLATRENQKRGAYLKPLVNQFMHQHRHYGFEVIHAVQPKTALRGTDVASIHAPMMGPVGWDPRNRIDEMMNKFAISHAKLLTVNTTWDPGVLGIRYGRKVQDKTRPVGMSFDPSYRIDPSVPRDIDVLWVGKSTPNKGVDIMLKALQMKLPGSTFVQSTRHGKFPVTHEEAKALASVVKVNQAVSDRVAGPGVAGFTFSDQPIPEPEMVRLFQRSKVIVCTSDNETFWQPGMEAYRCGTVVVVPRKPPHVQIYGMDAPGVVFYEKRTPLDVATAIARALERYPNGMQPAQHLVDQYSDKAFGERLLGVYEEVARR